MNAASDCTTALTLADRAHSVHNLLGARGLHQIPPSTGFHRGEHGFVVRRIEPNRIFYTMANSMTDSIRLNLRRKLSRLLGSACRIYVLDAPGAAGSLR